MVLWSIEWTPETSSYLDDNGPLVARLYLVIRDLARTDGIPIIGGATQEEPGIYI